MIFDSPMSPEEEKRLFYEGVRLFNNHQYFDAHEAWEEIWHHARGLKHNFYQAMIQASVSLEHYRRSNPRGVVGLHNSYRRRFTGIPAVCMGLNIERFLAEMEEVLRPVVSATPLPQRGEIDLDINLTPKLTVEYDPFESGEADDLQSTPAPIP